jgi:hypothetical protein
MLIGWRRGRRRSGREDPDRSSTETQTFLASRGQYDHRDRNDDEPHSQRPPAWPQKGARPAHETFAVFRLTAACTFHGTVACLCGLLIFQDFHPLADVFPMRPADVTWADLVPSVACGLLLANLPVLWRVTTR